MPEAPQWARVRGEMNCYIRRGAWYEVLRLTPEEVVIEVNRRPVRVERASVQIVPLRPHRWSVVARPRDSVDMPLSWGSSYAVCPGCGHRQFLPGQPTELPCDKCGGVFAIGWDDPY
jgi:hypothetical protein